MTNVQQSPRMTRAIPGYESRDPFELAAMRTQGSARPMAGRAGEGPSVRDVFDMTRAGTAAAVGPELLASATGQPATKGLKAAEGPSLADILAGPAEAGEQFQWSDPNKTRAQRLEAIDKELQKQTNTKTKSAVGTQKVYMEGLTAEKDKLLGQQNADMETARAEFNRANKAAVKAAEDKKFSETSLLDVVPGTRAAVVAASPYLSNKFGQFIGKRYGPAVAMPAATAMGGISGAVSLGGQNELDLLTLPRSSETRQNAQEDLSNPDFYKRMGLAAGVSAAFGAKGAMKGHASTLPDRTFQGPSPGSMPPANTGSMGSTPLPAGPLPGVPNTQPKAPVQASYTTYKTESGDKVVQTPHGWQGIHPDTGKWGFVKKPDGPLERLMKGE